MLLRGLGSIGCWRVSGEPGTFRSTFLRSRNLHACTLGCSGQFPPARTMFSGIILQTKTLLDIICAPVVTTLLFLVKTLAILYPGFFVQFYFSAIICLFFAQLFNYLSCYVIVLDFFCKSQLRL